MSTFSSKVVLAGIGFLALGLMAQAQINNGGSGGGGSTATQQTVAPGTAATNSGLTGCIYNSTAPTATNGQGLATQCDASGNTKVTVTNTNANGAAAASSSSPVTPSNQPVGAAAFSATQVSCASTATSVVAARTGVSGTGRIAETITNTTTTAIYLGGSGVTTSTGQLLPGIVGASLTVNTTAALYCIVASGTATVTSLETY